MLSTDNVGRKIQSIGLFDVERRIFFSLHGQSLIVVAGWERPRGSTEVDPCGTLPVLCIEKEL